jgi:hypothetical protein
MQKQFGNCQLYYFWVECQYVVLVLLLRYWWWNSQCWMVTLKATAKNSSRLKHCIEVCDTTYHCLSCSCNTVHFVFDVEGRPSVITNHFRNFNLVSIGQSRFKYLSILFENCFNTNLTWLPYISSQFQPSLDW